MLEKYLEMVAAHPVLGRSSHLASFLESASPPPRPAKMKKGWMAGVRDKWDSRNATAKVAFVSSVSENLVALIGLRRDVREGEGLGGELRDPDQGR